jgi:hypothetical protein
MLLSFSKFIAVALTLLILFGFVRAMNFWGWPFILGVISTALVFQFGYKAKHGTWFNLID